MRLDAFCGLFLFMQEQRSLVMDEETLKILLMLCNDVISVVDSDDSISDFVSTCEIGDIINRMRDIVSTVKWIDV